MKSPGDLRGLGLTQTPVEHHQLLIVGKTPKGLTIINLNTIFEIICEPFLFRILVSLFNGISTFVGYLMPKLFS